MPIDKDKLLAAIEARQEHAYGNDTDSSIARHRANLIEAYLGYNTNPAPPGRSQVVDRSVYETISTMLPSLVRIFASGDDVVKFMPKGPEDEPAAEQTTSYINHIVTQKNQWEQICSDWIHDAMLLGNSYAMAYWDDTENVQRETYEGQTEEQLAVLLQDGEVKVIEHSQRPDEEQDKLNAQAFQQAQQQYQMMAMQAQQQAQQTGQMPQLPPPPPPPQPAFLHDVVLERVEKEGKVKICVLPPEHCLIDQDTPDWTLNECDYFEFRQEKTIADLRSMGLDVPEDVNDDLDIGDEPEDSARNRHGENSVFYTDGEGVMRKVICRTIWVRCDAEGDDPRLYYVIAVGKTILYAEQTTRIPVAAMTPQPLPHRHPGLSVAEMVTDIQEIKTAIKRGGLDNLYLANNGRHAISEKVNLDDFLDSRPGGVVRLLDGALPGEGHIFPLQHPFAFDAIIGSLEYFDQDRQNRTGASRYFAGTDAGAINKTASGTAMLQNASAARVEHIARMFAPAFETLFSVVHELVSKHQQKADVIKLNGKWVNVDPTAWKTRRDVRISVGVGAGNKEAMMQALLAQAQAQMAMVPAGIVKPENLYATMTELAKLQGFANPDKFWTDPTQQPPKPPPPPPPELLKLEADKQKSQTDAQIRMKELELEAASLKLKEQEAQLDAELKKYTADLQSQTQITLKNMELTGQAEIKGAEMQNQAMLEQFRSEKTANLEEKKIRLNKDPAPDATERAEMALQHFAVLSDQFMQAMDGVRKVLGAAKRVKRGPDGKVEGVEILSPEGEIIGTQSVMRGPDGKIIGAQ